MARKISRCPVCDGALIVTEFQCARCAVKIGGIFKSCRFCRLAPEHLEFLETFLRCEGNLSRVEKALGISYPTVRNRFGAMLSALRLDEAAENVPAEDLVDKRRLVLEAVAQGAMSAEEAGKALRDTL